MEVEEATQAMVELAIRAMKLTKRLVSRADHTGAKPVPAALVAKLMGVGDAHEKITPLATEGMALCVEMKQAKTDEEKKAKEQAFAAKFKQIEEADPPEMRAARIAKYTKALDELEAFTGLCWDLKARL